MRMFPLRRDGVGGKDLLSNFGCQETLSDARQATMSPQCHAEGGGAIGGSGTPLPIGIEPARGPHSWSLECEQLRCGLRATRMEADEWKAAFGLLRDAMSHEQAAWKWKQVNILAEQARCVGCGSYGLMQRLGCVGAPEGVGLVGFGLCPTGGARRLGMLRALLLRW